MTQDATNFAAMVTFINPVETTPPWTAGLAFRSQEQVVLTSTGEVLSVHQGEEPTVLGQAMNFDPTPDARNTLQVFVLDNQMLIGVNGVPAAAGTLTDLSSGMGVSLIAGVFPQDQVPNRTIPYEDYRVWYGGEDAPETGRG